MWHKALILLSVLCFSLVGLVGCIEDEPYFPPQGLSNNGPKGTAAFAGGTVNDKLKEGQDGRDVVTGEDATNGGDDTAQPTDTTTGFDFGFVPQK